VTGKEQKRPAEEEQPRTAAEEVLKEFRDSEPRKAEGEQGEGSGEAGDATSPNTGAQEQSGKD
jgi:hypothetical protein